MCGQLMCVLVLCTTYMYPSSFPSLILLYCLSPPLPLHPYLPTLLLFLFYSLLFSPSSLFPLPPSLRLTLHKQRNHQPPTRTGETSGRAEQSKTTLLVLTQSLPRLLAPRLCASDSKICLRHQGECVCVCGVCVWGGGVQGWVDVC